MLHSILDSKAMPVSGNDELKKRTHKVGTSDLKKVLLMVLYEENKP